MKIKDLPKDKSLEGVAFLHPATRERCTWKSQWSGGVWFQKEPKSTQVFPLSVDKLEETLEWEVVS